MNKEINEMAEILLKASEKFYGTKCDKECADYEALILHEAGYRRQSDTIKKEREIHIKDFEKDLKTEIEYKPFSQYSCSCDVDINLTAENLYNAGYRKQEPIIIPTPIESGCAILCDTEKVAIKEFADKIIDLINSKADDFVVKDTYTKGKINGLRTAKMLIDELKKEYGVE